MAFTTANPAEAQTSTAATIRNYMAYEVYLGYDECARPDIDTKWIVVLHGTTTQSCTWYTTETLPKLDGYYKLVRRSVKGAEGRHDHIKCEYGISKTPIGRIGWDERVLFDALFEATEAQRSRRAVVDWLERVVAEGLLDREVFRGVMREIEMLRAFNISLPSLSVAGSLELDCDITAESLSNATAYAYTLRNTAQNTDSSDLSTGGKAGIGVGAEIGGLLVIVAVAWFVAKWNISTRTLESESGFFFVRRLRMRRRGRGIDGVSDGTLVVCFGYCVMERRVG
ncbi:hypothetical protein BJY00DRAFT_310384 [Aspergillus carlsbadensis]|nr:hypothetical protein BJY00DRAFT_310384 [Aspergillus carlsbadensis]